MPKGPAQAPLPPELPFEEILDYSADAVYITDIDYNLLYLNETACQKSDLVKSSVVGKKCYKCLMNRETPCPFCKISDMRTDAFSVRSFIHPVLHKSVELRGKLLPSAGGLLHIEYLKDITQRCLAEERGRMLSGGMQDIFDNIPTGICVYHLEEGRLVPVLHNRSFWNILGFSPENMLLEEKNAYVNVHPDDLGELRRAVEEGVRRLATVHQVYRVYNDEKQAYIWVSTMASPVRQAEGGLALYVSYSDVTEGTEAQMQIDKVLRSISGGLAVYRVDRGGQRALTVMFTDGVAKMQGYTRDEYAEIVRENAFICVYAGDLERLREAFFASVREQAPMHITYRIWHKNGSVIWVNLSAYPYGTDSEGSPIYYAVYNDVSQQFRLYQDVLDLANVGIVVLDESSHEVYYANKAAFALTGNAEVDYVGKKCHSILSGLEADCEACAGSRPLCAQDRERVIARNGRTLQVEVRHTNWMNRPATIQYLMDISSAKRYQRELEKERERYRLIVEKSGIALFDYDNATGESFENEAYSRYAVSSSPRGDTVNNRGSLDMVHPDDLPILQQFFQESADGRDFSAVQLRVRMADGGYRWTVMSGMYIRDAAGKLTRTIGLFRDIDDITSEYMALRQRFVTAVQASGMEVWTYHIPTHTLTRFRTAADGTMVQQPVKNAFDVLCGEHWIHPDDVYLLAALRDEVEAYNSGGACELRRRHSNGEYEWVRITYTSVQDGMGNSDTVWGTLASLSEQKNAEARYQYEVARRNVMDESAVELLTLNLTTGKVVEYSSERFSEPDTLPGKSIAYAASRIGLLLADAAAVPEAQAFFDVDRLKAAFSQGITPAIQYRRLVPGAAQSIWLRAVTHLVRDPVSGDLIAFMYTYDIDHSKTVEDMMNHLVQNNFEYVALVNADTGRIKLASAPKIKDFDPRVDELYDTVVNEFIDKVVVPEEREDVRKAASVAALKAALRDNPACSGNYSIVYHGHKGRRMWTAVYFDPKHEHLLITRSDVTDVYAQEMRRTAELQAALEKAEAATKAKSSFLARMSHDMRTPMNGILGLASLMRDRTDPAQIREDLDQLEVSGRYLLNLINDTLDMSKIENGQLELHPVVCDGRQLFNGTLGLLHPNILAKRIDFRVHADTLHFTTLYVDTSRVEQVVMNVVSNAVKFTPPGGRIDFYMDNISDQDGVLLDRIVVRDTGCGISPAFIPHIFEPFSQENENSVTTEQGTGLGMSIVKQLVELMGGKITVQSEKGKGTEVTMTLQLPRAKPEQIARNTTKAVAADVEILRGKRVLLCEDHPLNAQIATRLLQKMGVEVETAKNGEEGVQRFTQSPQHYFDAILMDIRMPVMDGLQATRAIRVLERADAAVPIIAMTANAFAEDVQESLRAGMDAHLAKPVEPEVLYTTLAEQIARGTK